MKLSLLIWILCALSWIQQCADVQRPREALNEPEQRRVVGRYRHQAIKESSGLVASRQFEGVYWTLNDSDNPPVLYATTLDGGLLGEFYVKGSYNRDWEALATDNKGQLWIGDIGNNMQQREDLTVYVVTEPDPTQQTEAEVVARYRYRYPERPVDAEALFVVDGFPYVVSKELTRAVLYRFTMLRTEEVNVLERVGQLADAKFVTGADLTPDGQRLAVCTYTALWVYERPNDLQTHTATGMAQLINSPPRYIRHMMSAEAVGFDGEGLVLTNESGLVYRISLSPTP